jgi:tetratricopeptide (TPR) repeat protein
LRDEEGGSVKRLSILLAMGLLVFSGCANDKIWLNSSKSDADAQKDLRECKYDSEKSSFVPYGNGVSVTSAAIQGAFQNSSLMTSCMVSRGYVLVDRSQIGTLTNPYDQSLKTIKDAISTKDINTILIAIDSHLNIYSADCEIYVLKANYYMQLSKWDIAIINFDKAIESSKDRRFGNELINLQKAVYRGKARCLLETGEFEISLALINVSIDLDRTNAELYNNRAYILTKIGDYDKAIEDCNKSIVLGTTAPEPYKNRGLAYFGKGQYERAIDSFNKSIASNNTYAKAYLGRGDVYEKLGKLDIAMLDFKKACEFGNQEACLKIK